MISASISDPLWDLDSCIFKVHEVLGSWNFLGSPWKLVFPLRLLGGWYLKSKSQGVLNEADSWPMLITGNSSSSFEQLYTYRLSQACPDFLNSSAYYQNQWSEVLSSCNFSLDIFILDWRAQYCSCLQDQDLYMLEGYQHWKNLHPLHECLPLVAIKQWILHHHNHHDPNMRQPLDVELVDYHCQLVWLEREKQEHGFIWGTTSLQRSSLTMKLVPLISFFRFIQPDFIQRW